MEGCEGALAIIVRWGEVNELFAHSSLKWTVCSLSQQQPRCAPPKAGTTSVLQRSNLPWVKMCRSPNRQMAEESSERKQEAFFLRRLVLRQSIHYRVLFER
jgi:hypothetical protein